MTPREQKNIDRLVRAINAAFNSPWQLFWRNVLAGFARGLGATLVLGAVFAILFYLLDLTGWMENFESLRKQLEEAASILNSNFR